MASALVRFCGQSTATHSHSKYYSSSFVPPIRSIAIVSELVTGLEVQKNDAGGGRVPVIYRINIH